MIDDPRVLRRLVNHHRPGVWIGAICRAIGPTADPASQRGLFETYPPQYLIALWKPLRRNQAALSRWPRKVMLVGPDATAAVAELLRDVPASDVLWLTGQEVDWALIAEIVILSESQLGPHQAEGLAQFMRDERDSTLAAIRENYRGSSAFPGQYEMTEPGALK